MGTSYLSLSSEEANGITGKTSRIIKRNVVLNCQQKSNFSPGPQRECTQCRHPATKGIAKPTSRQCAQLTPRDRPPGVPELFLQFMCRKGLHVCRCRPLYLSTSAVPGVGSEGGLDKDAEAPLVPADLALQTRCRFQRQPALDQDGAPDSVLCLRNGSLSLE